MTTPARLLLTVIITLVAALTANAKLRLHHLVSDNMVIQQLAEARLWGWDTPGKRVTVKVSWSGARHTAVADASGLWQVKVKTPQASHKPLSITVSDGTDRITVSNVLAGEVWVCGGQSNMEMGVRGYDGCPVEGANQTIAEASRYPAIRIAKVPAKMSAAPLADIDVSWQVSSSACVGWASAVAYNFAKTLNVSLDVPVGIILTYKGATRCESWLNAQNIKALTQEPTDSTEIVKQFKQPEIRPVLWGNGTFSPVSRYTVRGITFYQGCVNVGNPQVYYTKLLSALAKQWRSDFGLGDIPFYFVQIAPFAYGDPSGDAAAKLRADQFEASKVISNSGIVCTQDLVYAHEVNQIHPAQKKQVGERLAYLAMSGQYGLTELMSQSPSFKGMTVSGDSCIISLDNLYGSTNLMSGLKGFEVAGTDKVFHPAEASWCQGKGVIVTCPEVKNPVAVRYCWHNFMLGNVANLAGLPLFPFRTDSW